MDVIDRNLLRVRAVLQRKRLVPYTMDLRVPEATFVRPPQLNSNDLEPESSALRRWFGRWFGREQGT